MCARSLGRWLACVQRDQLVCLLASFFFSSYNTLYSFLFTFNRMRFRAQAEPKSPFLSFLSKFLFKLTDLVFSSNRNFSLYTLHSALYTLQFTLYNLQFIDLYLYLFYAMLSSLSRFFVFLLIVLFLSCFFFFLLYRFCFLWFGNNEILHSHIYISSDGQSCSLKQARGFIVFFKHSF